MHERQLPEILHFDPARPCCETPSAGDLFPDPLKLELNASNRGRVATVTIESSGMGVQARTVAVDADAWASCVQNPNFRACYDLSMAKLALAQALS